MRRTLLGQYRIVRELNNLGILASMRYSYWLVYGNPMFPPGELSAWFDAEVDAHPYAIGITLGIALSFLSLWVRWMVTR